MIIRAHIGKRQIIRGLFQLLFADRACRPSAAEPLTKQLNLRVKAEGRYWYLDNGVSMAGDGTTWATAWKSFEDIVWDDVGPADTIYISGGKTGKHYKETLTIGSSGRAGAAITITAGVDPGHSGEVTIDAECVRSNCIVVNSRNYLTIRHLTIRNNANDANLVVNGARAGVLIHGIISHSGMGSGGGNDCRCFDIRDCVATAGSIAVILQNCTASTPTSTTSQTDALWTSGNNGVLVQNNRFTVANTDSTGHSDCIQSYNDISVTYRCNLLAHPHGGLNNHGFIVSDVQPGGTLYFYNNIVVMGSAPGCANCRPEAAIFRQITTTDHTGTVKIWNNTIYGGSAGYHCGSTAGKIPAGDEFKNNIICILPNSVAAYEFQVGNLTIPANTDYNLVYEASRALAVYSCGHAVGAVRSTTSTAAGRVYFEVQLAEGIGSGGTLIGIANLKAALNRHTGASGDSLGWKWSDGVIYYEGGRLNAQGVSAGPSDVIAFAFDFAARKFWVNNLTQHSGWNADMVTNENPLSGSGGYSIPTGLSGPYFIMISVGGAGDGVILNTGTTPFVGALPTGFSSWGGATVLNSADISAPATLIAPVASIAGSHFEDRKGWKTLGYDPHGLGGDPLFVDPAALNFRLRNASPALRAGLALPAVTTDYEGRLRLQNAPYSLGAFQG